MNIGEPISELRIKKGLSQHDLAKIVGMSSSYLSRIEAGKKVPSPELAEKIAAALGVPSYYLLFMGVEVEKDVAEDKRLSYIKIRPAIQNLIEGFFL